MNIDLANLPTDIAALQALVRTMAGEIKELTQDAKAKGLKIAQLEARIAKLKRMQFGQSSEKIAREIEQLELELDELHEEEGRRAAERPAAVQKLIDKPTRSRCRIICRARKRCTSHPAPVRTAAAKCVGSARM